MTDPTPLPDWTSSGSQPPVPPQVPTTPAGWYPDPANAAALRYWDGAAWTAHQSAAAQQPTQWGYAAPAGASFGFAESVKRAFRKWSDFEGRATQSEFWWFYLFQIIATFVLYIPLVIAVFALVPSTAVTDEDGTTQFTGSPSGVGVGVAVVLGLLIAVVYLVLFVVGLSLAIRRLHDTGRSGWWYLLAFVPFGSLVLLYFWILASSPGPNQYGPPST